MFKFLTSKPLWVNILAGIVLLLLLLLLFLGSLSLLTQHGKTLRIPSVTGMAFADAKKTLQAQGFDVQIQDSSVFVDSMKPNQVVKQFPEADNLVKINRTIYLTINRSQAPFIKMPNVVSMSLRNAIAVLHQYGLNIGDTVFKPDFARNSVLDQQLNGETIKPGTEIQEGTRVTLVLGSGIGAQQVAVPPLIGLTYGEARARLDSFGLSIGVVVRDPDVRDTAEAYIYQQVPAQFGDGGQPNFIHMGQSIDIRLGTHRPANGPDSSLPQPSAY